MLEKIQNSLIRKKVEGLLREHGLEVKHHLPGRLRIAVLQWQAREEKLLALLREIESDQEVNSVEFTKETGTALIYYNKEAVTDSATLTRWRFIIEKYM